MSEEEIDSIKDKAVPSCSSPSQSNSIYSQSPLPECTPRFSAKFELLLTYNKVIYCNNMFETNEEYKSAIYNSWKALKIASLPAGERCFEDYSCCTHSKKYRTKKTESVQGVDRYLPTSEEHMALLQVMSARVSKQIRKKQVERQGRWKSKKTKPLFSKKN